MGVWPVGILSARQGRGLGARQERGANTPNSGSFSFTKVGASAKKPGAPRRLHAEPLEQRQLLAISPTLVSILPNAGDVLLQGQTRNVAPTELTFRFDEGQAFNTGTLATGIQIVRAGGDGAFGNGNDVTITPGFIGIGELSNEIVVRFASTLPDDQYRITIVGQGAGALKNAEGQAFNNGVDLARNFRLDLGAQIVGVVPQPITRNAQGQLTQRRDQVVVYFNNDRLDLASAQNPAFYQLIFTGNSASNVDDVRYLPTTVSYNPTTFAATLTFATNIDLLGSGAGTFRLRVGDNSDQLPAPVVMDLASLVDAGSSLGTAINLGPLGTQSFVLSNGAIDPSASPTNFPYNLPWPGGSDEPGHRDVPALPYINGVDNEAGITTIAYNFRIDYGFDPNGNPLFNVITEDQKERAREIFELYGYYLGVQFVETDNSGFTIATGDLRAVAPSIPTGPGGAAGISGGMVAIMDAAENWGSSEFGGDWFQTAVREVGHLLGIFHEQDTAPLTLAGGTGEVVFPSSDAIVQGQSLYRPESKDVDFYQFRLNTAGRFSAEIIAERIANSSLLDAVVTLFDANGNIVARNDDYFSSDSFLDLQLGPGTYYVAVSSTGNTGYDPKVVDSGMGGTTQGKYDLRLNFTPTLTSGLLVDATGVAIDGDADGDPGGAFNFWFDTNAAANTIYVDKTANAATANGTLANPYNNIQQALALATPGSVVRIVGNAGADGNLATFADNHAYEIGLDGFGAPLTDGATFDIPQGVTVMIDAGAVFKLRAANINAGSFSPGIDLSGGALQVLGTPSAPAIFTSWNNDAVGVQDNPLDTATDAGDWGGLVFRADSDLEQHGIFKNYVGQASIGYGGGTVVVDSVPLVFTPIHIEKSRPLIMRNAIINSADAAISADPDAFEETLFRDNTYTSRYRRVGPDIHGNSLSNNSINGLFIRIRTEAGEPVDVLTVAGRFDDTDIVHVIAENLVVRGTPGGPRAIGGTLQARTDASLAIDPGIIVKLSGSRIEVGVGAQLIAEGSERTQVVFTSLADDRYGRGGVFDTTGDGTATIGAPGDWGGLYFSPASKGSLDGAVVTYGGGNTPIEGGFARFNAIEIHQADVRIVNSVIERNSNGLEADSTRNGRGQNASAVIFVLGAQPVIVDNILRNNFGDAINIDVNSLTSTVRGDTGRTTGAIDLFGRFNDNHGPLVRLNRVVNNTVNALAVRGGVVTTESVWDDTDIVHVVRDEILIPNFRTFGGVRLESSSTESLVIKLSGQQAGFTASGTPLDIDDRIGGRLEVIGRPGKPVVFTSLKDGSVGAGFDLNGQPQNATVAAALGGSEPGGFNIEFRFGPQIQSNPQALAAVAMVESILESMFSDPVTIVLDFELAPLPPGVLGGTLPVMDTITYDELRARMVAETTGQTTILQQLPTLAQLVMGLPVDNANPWFFTNQFQATRANLLALGVDPDDLVVVPSLYDPTTPVDAQIEFATAYPWDFDPTDGLTGEDFVATVLHEIGHALGFISSVDDVDFVLASQSTERQVIPNPLDLFRLLPGAGAQDFTNATRIMTPTVPNHVFYDGGFFDPTTLGIQGIPGLTVGDVPLATGQFVGDGTQASHWKDDVLLGIMSAIGLMDPIAGIENQITSADVRAFDLIGFDLVTTGAPGDWRSLKLDQFSHDRNVETVIELEPTYTGGNDLNAAAAAAQNLGTLARNEYGGDDVLRLGFEIHGAISYDRPGDVDTYSFNATPGTEVWFDIDRTAASLDTVVELLDSSGNLIARSNDSTSERAGTTSIVKGPLYASTFAATMNKSDYDLDDNYTTNPRDAGMRVVLPAGPPGVAQPTYFVRVRSNSADLTNLAGGQTRGEYQLQIRLRELDEVPGSTIRFADVRYATNGIEVIGMPGHSPLAGEAGGVPSNTSFASAQNLGNLLAADRNAISVSSALTSATDVDWFRFTIDYQMLNFLQGYNAGGKTWATIFDIDYADGLSRPDLTLSLFDEFGRLIAVSRDSNIVDDQPAPLEGNDADDLSRGTFGQLDPFLGTLQLEEGEAKTYFVAISSNATLPTALNAMFTDASTNRLVRLEPVSSVRRIVEDHIGYTGYNTGNGGSVQPTTGGILNINDPIKLGTQVRPFTLSDLGLFVSQSEEFNEPGRTYLYSVDPRTGAIEARIGDMDVPITTSPNTGSMLDIAMRSDGYLFATAPVQGDPVGGLYQIDPGTGQHVFLGDTNLPLRPDPLPADLTTINAGAFNPDFGGLIEAMAYLRLDVSVVENADGTIRDVVSEIPGPGVGEHYALYYSITDVFFDAGYFGEMSRLFYVKTDDGSANIRPNQPWGPVSVDGAEPYFSGALYMNSPFDTGLVTGMTFVRRQTTALIAPQSGAIIPDGAFFTVSDANHTVAFEFDRNGVVTPGRVAVPFTSASTQLELANAIITAINGSTLNVTADDDWGEFDPSGFGAFDGSVVIYGGYDVVPGSSHIDEFQMPNESRVMFGVTPNGELVKIDPEGFGLGTGGLVFEKWLADQVEIADENGAPSGAFLDHLPEFTGLALGPQNLDLNGDGIGGDLAETIFAITENGDIYAFDTRGGANPNGQAGEPLLRTDLWGGATHISTQIENATGLAFSPLDFNMWHPTLQGQTDAGHGTNQSADRARDDLGTAEEADRLAGVNGASTNIGPDSQGGASFYFGLETWSGLQQNRYLSYTNQTHYGANQQSTQFGILRYEDQLDLTAYALRDFTNEAVLDGTAVPSGMRASAELRDRVLLGNNFNTAGGSHGSLITDGFSLKGYSAGDKPTLYFNYYLDTESAASQLNNPLSPMLDSARVFASIDGGQTWQMLTTNNSTLNQELPTYTSPSSSTGSGDSRQRVQELFDTSTAPNVSDRDRAFEWRQARVDLGDFAGYDNVVLRFDFSTAGDITDPSQQPGHLDAGKSLPGDQFGAFNDARRGQNNNYRGFYIDDIIVGFAERGELVTGATPNPLFTSLPTNPNPNAPSQVLVGAYQLEIRRGQEYGQIVDQLFPGVQITQQIDTNDRQASVFTLVAPAGSQLADGQTLVVSDGINVRTFEFDNNNSVTPGRVRIAFAAIDSPEQVARSIITAINGQKGATFGVSAASNTTGVVNLAQNTSDRVNLHGAMTVNAANAATLDIMQFDMLGDRNLHREQGQILIHSNTISDSLRYGVVADAGVRDPANSAHPGAVRNLTVQNTQRLAPGVTIFNNLIVAGGLGGILFSGDPNSNDAQGNAVAPGPVPFGRLINNTIVGEGRGIGIHVTENAGPTIINNILADLATGVSVDASSVATTVLGGNLFQDNTANTVGATLGSFPVALSAGEALFVDAANRNFNLTAGSKAIDSSINSLADRPSLSAVKSPLGLGVSPILAPAADLTGKSRIDDPAVVSPPGLGANVFKDRGAIDRSDFVGPVASLLKPVPGTPVGSLTDMQVQLSDTAGSGIDDLTVFSSKFVMRRNGVVLVEGVDYTFGYDATNNVVKFTPLSGLFLSGSVYTITIDNTAATGVKDLAGNRLQPTDGTGITQFVIPLLPMDFGDAPDPKYQTFALNNGARHVIVSGFYLGAGVTEDPDGNPDEAAATDSLDDGVAFNSPLIPGQLVSLTVTASAAGKLDAWIDLNGDGDWDDPGEKIFNNRALAAGANALSFTMPAATATTTFSRFRFSSAGGLAPSGLANDGEVEDYQVAIPQTVSYTVVLVNPATGVELPKNASGRYVALQGQTVRAMVYVDDLRPVGAAGGVSAAFADLLHIGSEFTWNSGSLVVAPGFANAPSGTVANNEVNEAGGARNGSPVGADPRQLLFRVDGAVNVAAVPGAIITFELNAADELPDHTTSVYGVAGAVSATYNTIQLEVPLNAWQNPLAPLDVNNDGFIVGLDALIIINALNSGLAGPLANPPQPPFVPPPFLDVDGDGILAPLDALIIINYLNALVSGGAIASSSPAVMADLVEETTTVATASAAPRVASMEIELPIGGGSAFAAPANLVDLALGADDAPATPTPSTAATTALSRAADRRSDNGDDDLDDGDDLPNSVLHGAADHLAGLRHGLGGSLQQNDDVRDEAFGLLFGDDALLARPHAAGARRWRR